MVSKGPGMPAPNPSYPNVIGKCDQYHFSAVTPLEPRLEKGPDNLVILAYAKLCEFHDGLYCSFQP